MDSKLLLSKCIQLLYRETTIADNKDTSSDLVRRVMDEMQIPENAFELDKTRDIIVSLRSTIQWLLEQPSSNKVSKDALLQRVRINVGEEEYLYTAIAEACRDFEDPLDAEKDANTVRSELYAHLNKTSLKTALKKAYTKSHFEDDRLEWSGFLAELTAELEGFQGGFTGKRASQELVTEIDISNKAKLSQLIQKSMEANSSDGVLSLGWQGINRMLGDVAGLRRGDMAVIGALQHNFKSGTLLHMLRQVAMYNKPYMLNPNKKPLLIHLSLENSVEDNIMILYKYLMEIKTGELCDIRNVDTEAAAAFVHEQLGVNGYHVKFLRADPSEFTYMKLFDLLNMYQQDGYEVHMVANDYTNMMSKVGCTGGNTSAEIRDLFRRIRNYCHPRGITYLTAHQLSSEAKALLRMGVDEFVKEVANKGYWDSCKAIDQEIDLEIIQHIEKFGGCSWLTFQRGKHRKPSVTPEADLYTVYKFFDIGTIPDDVGGPDQSRKKIGNGMSGGDDDFSWD